MCYDLITIRNGCFVEDSGQSSNLSGPARKDGFVVPFRKIAEHLSQSEKFIELYRDFVENFQNELADAAADLLDETNKAVAEFEIINLDPSREATHLPPRKLVARFRARKFRARIGDQTWQIRLRYSITSCGLDAEEGFMKIWNTFEAFPIEGLGRLDDFQLRNAVAALIDFVRGLSSIAYPYLLDMYKDAFNAIIIPDQNLLAPQEIGKLRYRPERLEVIFADNEHPEFAAYIKSLTPDFQDLNSAKQELASVGQHEFENFCQSIDKNFNATDTDVRTITNLNKVSGVYHEIAHNNRTSIVGLARRSAARSMGSVFGANRTDIHFMRFIAGISASKPVSGFIATELARRTEKSIMSNSLRVSRIADFA